MGSAVRERPSDGSERDCNFLRCVSECDTVDTNISETAPDLVVMGSDSSPQVNLDDPESATVSARISPVARSLQEVGFRSTIELFATYLLVRPNSGHGRPALDQSRPKSAVAISRGYRAEYCE